MAYPFFRNSAASGPVPEVTREVAIARARQRSAELDAQFTPEERHRIFQLENEMGIPHHVGRPLPEAEDGHEGPSAHFEE